MKQFECSYSLECLNLQKCSMVNVRSISLIEKNVYVTWNKSKLRTLQSKNRSIHHRSIYNQLLNFFALLRIWDTITPKFLIWLKILMSLSNPGLLNYLKRILSVRSVMRSWRLRAEYFSVTMVTSSARPASAIPRSAEFYSTTIFFLKPKHLDPDLPHLPSAPRPD